MFLKFLGKTLVHFVSEHFVLTLYGWMLVVGGWWLVVLEWVEDDVVCSLRCHFCRTVSFEFLCRMLYIFPLVIAIYIDPYVFISVVGLLGG